VLAGFFFRAKFHSNSLYVVEKKIVQWESRSTPTLDSRPLSNPIMRLLGQKQFRDIRWNSGMTGKT
jgi:hypothetical protein